MISNKRNLSLIAMTMMLASTGLSAEAATEAPSATKVVPATPKTAESANIEVDMNKISEAFGHFIGRHLKSPGVEFNVDAVVQGIREGAEGKPAPLSDKEYEQMMAQVQKSAFDKISKDNLKAANEYLEKHSQDKGIVIVEPGKLEYEIIQQGTGEAVAPHSTPQINYTGKFIDGTTFGSSTDSGGPVVIPLDQTIQGFSKGIAGMKEGEKRRLYVHPDLGYGTTGHLPPNSLLIFDIEVVKANAQEKSILNDDEDDEEDDIAPLALSNNSNINGHNYGDDDDRFDEDGYDS